MDPKYCLASKLYFPSPFSYHHPQMTLSFLPFSLLKPLNTFFLHTLGQLMIWLPISIGVQGGDRHSTRRECPISHHCGAPWPRPINAVHPLPFSHVQGCHASISLFFSVLSVIPSPLDCCHQQANMLLILPFKKNTKLPDLTFPSICLSITL